MTKRSATPAKPHAKKKAARRVLAPDEEWARGIRMRVIADAHPWQRDGIVDPHELVSMRVGRGGAKTTTMRAREIIRLVTLREQRLGFAATSKDQAHDLMWPQLKRACEAYELRSTVTNIITKQPDLHVLDAKLSITCNRTGTTLKLRGVEDKKDAEKFRGFPQSEFDIDEAGSYPPELLRYLIEECVQPRIGEAWNIRFLDDIGDQVEIVRGGCIVMGSTPPAQLVGVFYDATKPSGTDHRPYAERDDRTALWSSHNWTLKDVVDLPHSEERFPALWHLWQKALKRKADKGWADDHPVWRREYLGEWAADFTTSVFRFNTEKNVWKPCGEQRVDGLKQLEMALAALPKDVGAFHHVVTLDGGGSRDPDACNAFSFAPADPRRRLFHTFCYEAPNRGVRPLAELLIGADSVLQIMGGRGHGKLGGLFGMLGWPDGLEMDADDAIITELMSVYGIQCKKSERRADYKFGAVELVNGDFLGEKIFVIAKTALADQLAGLQWKADEYNRLKEHPGQPNHCTDCLLYAHRLVATLYDSGVVSHEAPAQVGFVDPMGLGPSPGVDPDIATEESLLAPSEWSEDDEDW